MASHGYPALRKTPEQLELERLEAEVARLQDDVAEAELDLVTLRTRLDAFNERYSQAVAGRYAKLDRIRLVLAFLDSLDHPHDPDVTSHFEDARDEERTSRESYQESYDEDDEPTSQASSREDGVAEPDTAPDFQRSADLKQKYRQAAKRIHPDLATSEEEREYRSEMMRRLNAAYEKDDEVAIDMLMDEWATDPYSVKGENKEARFERLIRLRHQLLQRLIAIKHERAELEESDLYSLYEQAQDLEADGQDIWKLLTRQIDEQIEGELHAVVERLS